MITDNKPRYCKIKAHNVELKSSFDSLDKELMSRCVGILDSYCMEDGTLTLQYYGPRQTKLIGVFKTGPIDIVGDTEELLSNVLDARSETAPAATKYRYPGPW